MSSVGLFHEDGEIQSRRTTAYDVDLHLHLFQKLTRNNNLLDLGSAFIDAKCSYIAIQAFNHTAPDQAGTTVNLYSAVDNASCSFSRIELCLACFSCNSRRACVFQIRRPVKK